MYRIMWFTDKQEAIALAEKVAADNGCTARGAFGEWEMYNPACPEANAVVVQKAPLEPGRKGIPEGYEVALRCNVYGELEKWPGWLRERGVLPDQLYPVGGLLLGPGGELVVAGGVVSYRLTEVGLQKVWDAYGPPRPRRETRRPLQLV